ncbi:hypothetical protein ACN47E_008522 [Coniothyrium glycines]
MSAERKRAYSQATQPPPKRMRHPLVQAAENIAGVSNITPPSAFFTPATSYHHDKENVLPMFIGNGNVPCTPFAGEPFAVRSKKASPLQGPPLQDFFCKQYTGFEKSYGVAPRQLYLDSSPPGLAFDSSSSPQDVLDMQLDSEPGPVIYEDVNVAMDGQAAFMGPPTPTDLRFHQLSLLDMPSQSLPEIPSQLVAPQTRTTFYTVETSSLAEVFPSISPNEVIIIFNRGKEAIKADKYPLCNASRFFHHLLSSPISHTHTPCIRLRDDFPYAIKAMLQYLATGLYIFDPSMSQHHAHITMLDLHIHAYLAGTKYEIPALAAYAAAQYANFAHMILSIRTAIDACVHQPAAPPPTPCNPTPSPRMRLAYPAPAGPAPVLDPSTPLYDGLLDSFVLLWRNTYSRHDALRAAALELIKPALHHLMKVDFFVTLMLHMVAFGDDVVHSLAEDGFHVAAYPVPVGVRRRWTVRFGGRV